MSRIAILLVLAGLGAVSCSSTPKFEKSNTTQVNLSHGNYRVVQTAVEGTSHGFSLLGLIPIVSPSAASAKADLQRNVKTSMEGKATALVNFTEDRGSLYLILFSIPRLSYTADVVEFTDQGQGPAPVR